MSDVDLRIEGRAGRVILNRPKSLNALTHNMVLDIEWALDTWRTEPSVGLVIIEGNGDKAFCAGGDIQALYYQGKAGNLEYGRCFWQDEYRLNAKIARYPKPIVAVMDGLVMGGGVGVGAHASHRVVTEKSVVAMPEVSIGFLPDVGGTYLLSRAPGRVGEYLAMSGARMSAEDAILAGFADLFVPRGRIEEVKKSVCKGDPDKAWELGDRPPSGHLDAHRTEIDQIFALEDAVKIMAALSESGTDWSKSTADAMRRGSPLSLGSALKAVRAARALPSLEACLVFEYRFSHRATEFSDFLEGIRASIIEKDRDPRWRYESLEEVPARDVESLFEPLGDDELRV